MRFVTKWYKTAVLAAAIMMLPGITETRCIPQNVDFTSGQNECIPEFSVDGPYVFYKRNLTIVRNVERKENGKLAAIKEIYDSNEETPILTCKVDNESGVSFKIKLHSTYSVPPSTYPQPEKLFAISDIEGNFEAFSSTLLGNGIINNQFEWTYGNGHLVLVGDFFDRGKNVTEVLWLIYELERQAAEVGGMVHFINGNHEEMNLRGDTRYVDEKYFQVAQAFKQKYVALYGANTELGRWLRSKNVIERIGKTLFTHGGLSPQIASSHLSLKEINKIARDNYGRSIFQIEKAGGMTERVYSMVGPMWYRGYFSGELQAHEIINVLNQYEAESVVVGHTIVPNVSGIFDNRIIAIDVKHCVALEDGTANSLLIENGDYYAVNSNGKKNPVYPMLTKNEVVKVFTAIRENNLSDVKQFLLNGNKINKFYSSRQYTLLHYAVKNNQPAIVEFLLEKGANIEQLYEEQTPLMFAVKLQHLEIADILIRYGVDVNTLNVEQESALFFCAKNGDLEILKFLIANGANPKIKDSKGRTAVDYALKHENKAVVDYLKSL